MHWFIDPIKNQYADFDGRTGRKAYWMFVLVSFSLQFVVAIMEGVIGTSFLGFLISLAILVPSIAIATRRLHDINKSGWWQLIALVPIIGVIILIVWLASESKDEGNQYGEGVAADVPIVPAAPATETAQEVRESSTSETVSAEPENTQKGYGN